MADLQFNIKASFEEVAKARQELQRLRAELQNTTKATDAAKRQDLSEQYNEQAAKVRDLTAAIQRYSFVMSKDFGKNMQRLTREVYSFELQADASQRKIEKLSSEIGKMQYKLRKGGLDAGTQSVLNTNIGESSKALTDEKTRYESLIGLGKQARTELQNMQAEYARYSGSSTAATDNVKVMTDAFANMISEMKQVPTVGEGATSLFNRLGSDAKQLAMSLVGGLGFEQLAEHIFNVRSQFQQLEISFNTMLGSEQKAGALMDQLIDTAAKTPFDMAQVTQGAKQLLAYGTAANEVNDILIHLGDISAGLSVPLGDLVYLYGTTMAQGRMYTMDLRQFMGRGIPMAEELGKLMGKTTQEVQQAVTDGKVGADLVKKAIIDMTAEGGKFGGLMEKQSKTLQGQWSNIGDSVDQMFNELGKKSEGVFGTGLELISALVDNWETLVKVIGVAATTVGVYKASLMAAASIQKAQNKATLDGITNNLDNQIQAYKDQAELYHSYNGKDTSEYRNKRLADLNEAVGNTDLIGNDKAEELVSLKIKEAQTDGIITKEMAEQLQIKRDLLVAQQQSAAKEQQEVVELSKGLDEKMAQYKEMENDYRHLNGKDTKDYKANRYNELSSTLSDTENIGDEGVEKMVSDQIKLAQSEGLISEEMAKQLQLKRDLLVEQSKLAEKEQLQWQNAVNAREQAEEELRVKKEEEAEIARINALAAQKKAEEELTQKIAQANKTKYGQALLETHELEKQVDLLTESKDKAMDDALAKKQALVAIDEQVKKQQELLAQKEKEIVYDNGAVDQTSFGGYEDAFSQNENTAIVEYEAEQAKLEELMQKRQQASDEFEQAYNKRRSIQDELENATDKLAEAQEREIEIYKETGAEADEIQGIVEQGIAIKEGDATITEAATIATQTNTASENANSTAKNVNAEATARQTTTNAANTAAETANTTATNVNTASKNMNTGAKERNSLVTSVLSVGNKGLAIAENVLTWATNAVTTSLKGLWAAMLANPIATVITLVTTAISVFSMFSSEDEDAAQKTEDMGNKAAEASNKVRSLFSVLSTGKAEDHKDAINELKAAYEEYGIQLDESRMKSKDAGEQLEELKSHEEELIGLIEKRSVEMERANQLQQAYSDYNTANDTSYDTFKSDVGGKLSDVEKGQIRSLISQDDIDKLAQLSAEMKQCGDDLTVYNALNAQYSKIQGSVNAKIDTYLEGMRHSKDEVKNVIVDISKYTDGLVENKVALDGKTDSINKSADAAERARKTMSKLTYEQEENALKVRYSKKSFKELNAEIQDTIKMCSQNYSFTVKVNYDDSELPAWIKGMSNAQLKRSIAARRNWLESKPKKGSVLKIGGHIETVEQATNTLAMLQARGTNEESKPKKTQKELDKEKKAREKAAAAAEKAKNLAETQAGNRKKASEDYANTLSSYSEKAEEDLRKSKVSLMQEGYDKEIAEIKENDEKEKKAIEDGIDKLVEARKKRDQTIWVNSGKNRKANMWKADKTDSQYRDEVMKETMKDSKGNEIKGDDGKVMTIKDAYDKRLSDVEEKTNKSMSDLNEKQLQIVRDYVKTYGEYEEKRVAITEEADKKIKEINENASLSPTEKEYQTKTVNKELQKSLNNLDFEELKKNINWDYIFGDLEHSEPDTIRVVKDQLQQYIDTAKELTPEEIKTVTDALEKLQDKMDLSEPIKTIKEARQEYKAAKDEYDKYKADYDKADSSGDDAGKKKAANGMTKASQKMTKAQNKESKAFSSTISVVSQYADALNDLGDTMGGTTGDMVKLAASAITCGLSMAEGIDKFGKAVSNMEKAIAILAIIEAALKAIQVITNLFGDSADATLTDYVDTLNVYIKLLNDSISDLNDSMGDTKNSMRDTIAYYDKLVNLEKESATAIKSQSNTWLNSGASKGLMGIGSKSSEGVKIRKQIEKDLKSSNAEVKKFYQEGYNSLNEYYKKVNGVYAKSASDFGRMDFIWKLSDEELVKLSEDTKALSLLGDTLSSAITDYAAKIKAAKDDEDSLAESLLTVSFDDFYDDFTDMIKDMDNSSADFANNFAEYMRNALVKSLVAEQYKGKLEDLYKQATTWAKDGVLEQHIGELRQKYADYAKQAQDEIKTIDDIVGYDSNYEQKASSGAFESMSQDTGEELNGRFTAVQIATEGTYQVVQSIDQKLSQMLGLESSGTDIVGATKEEETAKVDDNVTKTISDKLKDKFDDLINDSLIFEGSTLGMIDSINKQRLLSGKHSLEYESGMSTEDLASYINSKRADKFNTELASYLQDTNQLVATETPNTRSDSLLTADISLISQNVGNIYVAVDEGRTILAQSLMCLQSIDERQESWHKPMLQAFNELHDIREKIQRL